MRATRGQCWRSPSARDYRRSYGGVPPRFFGLDGRLRERKTEVVRMLSSPGATHDAWY
jgi:hypothetical protein